MRRAAQRGFTLIEVVVAMVLLGAMMLLVYGGLSFSLRSWDASEANGRRVVERRVGENFLRRELMELFPMRWKDALQVKLAFEGGAHRLRFVSARPAGIQMGGLSLVGLEVGEEGERGRRSLLMVRAMPDDEAKDFGPLEQGERHVILPDVDQVSFAYFGSENEFSDPRWHDTWEFAGRIPSMVRVRARGTDGQYLPELVVRLALGEEAGCLESSFQRLCRPRRPT